MSYTKGPWEAWGESEWEGCGIMAPNMESPSQNPPQLFFYDDRTYIHVGFKQARRDAQLAAAAPELYEALKLAAEYYEMLEEATGVEHGVLSAIREALTKAEGKS